MEQRLLQTLARAERVYGDLIAMRFFFPSYINDGDVRFVEAALFLARKNVQYYKHYNVTRKES